MVLANFITLEEGRPKRMHFTAHRIERRERRDPKSVQVTPVNALVFDVDEEDGLPVSKTWSTLSEKLAKALEPYLKDQEYRRRTMIITRKGSDFFTEYEIQAPLR